jgi:hypothetical protein
MEEGKLTQAVGLGWDRDGPLGLRNRTNSPGNLQWKEEGKGTAKGCELTWWGIAVIDLT